MYSFKRLLRQASKFGEQMHSDAFIATYEKAVQREREFYYLNVVLKKMGKLFIVFRLKAHLSN